MTRVHDILKAEMEALDRQLLQEVAERLKVCAVRDLMKSSASPSAPIIIEPYRRQNIKFLGGFTTYPDKEQSMAAVKSEAETAVPEDILTAKAQAVYQDTGFSPEAGGPGLGSIITIILQLLQGLGLCKPTATQVHQTLVNPNRRHQRILRRTVERTIDDPVQATVVEDSVRAVASKLTTAESWALYEQANSQG